MKRLLIDRFMDCDCLPENEDATFRIECKLLVVVLYDMMDAGEGSLQIRREPVLLVASGRNCIRGVSVHARMRRCNADPASSKLRVMIHSKMIIHDLGLHCRP